MFSKVLKGRSLRLFAGPTTEDPAGASKHVVFQLCEGPRAQATNVYPRFFIWVPH